MLALSRKKSQSILLGDDIRITVVKVQGNRVTLAIEAPDHVRILRDELIPVLDHDPEAVLEQTVPVA